MDPISFVNSLDIIIIIISVKGIVFLLIVLVFSCSQVQADATCGVAPATTSSGHKFVFAKSC